MKAYQYFTENSKGAFLNSNELFYKWKQAFYENKESYLKHSTLLSDNRSIFKELFGKQNFTTITSSRRRCYGWYFKLNHGELWILTAYERGTSYEWNPKDKSLCTKEIIEFLEKLMNDIKNLNQGEL